MEFEMNRTLFRQLCDEVVCSEHKRYSIGTYQEKKLHLILKNYFSFGQPDAKQEVSCLGYVADVMTANGIVEIQTGSFGAMKGKLDAFLPEFPVMIVYPVAGKKWLSWIDPETGSISSRRSSPKKGSAIQILPEMIYLRQYLRRENLTFLAVMLEIEEYRWLDGWSRDKKKGSHRYERIPVDVLSAYTFSCREDYAALLPAEEVLPEPFVLRELIKTVGMGYGDGQKALTILRDVGAVEKTGKRGRADTYCRTH